MIDVYHVSVADKPVRDQKSYIPQATMAMFKNLPNMTEASLTDPKDPYEQENKEQTAELQQSTKKVPVYILSPAVNIVWLYLCAPFRKQMDFNFQRPANWTDDTPVLRFNDTKYISMHNIFDWHDFAVLQDETMIYPSLLVQITPTVMWYICEIKYEMPAHLKNLSPRSDFTDVLQKNFWKCEAYLTYNQVVYHHNQWHVNPRKQSHHLQSHDKYLIVDPDNLQDDIIDHNGNQFIIQDVRQHPDVQKNKPFFFSILGFDKYHHTTFTGKHDWDTHGLYWWFGNIKKHCQFTKKMTMITSQVPNCVSLSQSAKLVYEHWLHIINSGVPIWHGNQMITAYGMISHQITDMEDRDVLLHRRGNHKRSRCDGATWLGYEEGVRWPDGVTDLMQLDVLTPGHYLGTLTNHVNEECVERGCWDTFPDDYGRAITLTKATQDVYGGIPLASSLKSTIELNHTTLLGCLTQIFKLSWYNMHQTKNLNVTHTRHIMKAYLQQYFHQVNGINSILMNNKTKMTVFNQFQHAWQKMIEILMCLPACVNWYYNLDTVIALTRLTGVLFTIKTENDRKHAQKLMKLICEASLVYMS